MTVDSAELAVLRRQTQRFIEENPVSITIKRTITESDGAGGRKPATDQGQPIDPQVFRLIPQLRGGMVATRDVDGNRVKPEYVLIGTYDADIKGGDGFTYQGREFYVSFVRLDRDYETWAEVMYRG